MNIIKPYFVIESDVNGGEALKLIEKAGRTCYKSEDYINESSAAEFVRRIIKHGHEAVIEHYSITVRVVCDRGVCYSQDTKVLTENGWKYFCDLSENESVYTLDDDGELILIKPKKMIIQPYLGKMLRFHSTQIDLLVTPNHNMWIYDYQKRNTNERIWKFKKAEEITNRRYRFMKGAIKFDGNKPENIQIPSVMVRRGFYDKEFPGLIVKADLLMKFFGIWVTDGCVSFGNGKWGNRITIVQKKPYGRQYIETLLSELNLHYNKKGSEYIIHHPALFNFLVENFIHDNNCRKTYYVRVPQWIKNSHPSLLQAFLEGVLTGDGTPHTKGRGFQIYTASLGFAEDLVEICLKVGNSANIYEQKIRYTPERDIQQRKLQYIVSIVTTTEHLYNRTEKSFEEVNYNGTVYCVELPKYHRLYVMRNGKACWCGNSHEVVRHRLASYSQESTRYCNYSKDKFDNQLTFIEPFFWDVNTDEGRKKYEIWKNAMEFTEKSYLDLIANGATPQEARSVLPNSLKTELVMTMNLREWRNFFKLRTSTASHPQMREIAVPLLARFKELIPVVFEDID